MLIAEVPKNQKALVGMNSTLPSALVHRPPKVITPTSRYAPRDDWCFAASKNVGADSISARARLRQDKLPRAHIECAPTDYVSGQREKAPRGAPPSLGPLCEGAPPAGGGGENRGTGRNISGLDCQKTFVGASIARPCPLALQENCPGKCVAAVG